MNSRETPQSFDVKKLKDFNNFYFYLPGGKNRSPELVTFKRTKKIITDLDKTATKLGIDTSALFVEIEKGHSKVWEAIKMMQKKGDSLEVRKIAEEGDAIRQEVHKKLVPLFEEMLKLGYTPNELMA